MMSNVGPNTGRLSLAADLNRKMFIAAMDTLRERKLDLREYDRKLFYDLEEGYKLAGASMTISVKQMNHIKQIAWDFEKGA